MRKLTALLVGLVIAGCGSSVKRLGDGSLRIQCDGVLSTCMRQAENRCRTEGGVHVLSASEKNQLYGVEGNQSGVLASEVVFVCNSDAPRTPIKLPPKTAAASAEPASSAPPQASAAQARGRPKHICIPGSTQKCIGAGACVGGQACLRDGAGFGPCECAPLPSPHPEGSAPSAGTAPDAGSSPGTSDLAGSHAATTDGGIAPAR